MHIEGPNALFWIVYLLLMLFGSSIAGFVAAIYLLARFLDGSDRS